VLFLVHPDRSAAKELAAVARAWWEARGFGVVDAGAAVADDLEQPPSEGAHEFAVSFGGDGTMLRTLQLARTGRIPVIGINLGHMGYLAEVEPSGMERAFERLVAGDYQVVERVALEVALHRADGESHGVNGAPDRRFSAINEAIVERNAPGHTIRVSVDIAGVRFLTYVADGLLVCTPTGSTAYNLSARGPVISPNMRALVLTAVAPHLIFDRSLVLGLGEPVTLTLLDGRSATLVLDGSHSEALGEGDSVVCSAADVDARFVTFGDVDFHAVLRSRFSLADG
jgi:NAD+ kinase